MVYLKAKLLCYLQITASQDVEFRVSRTDEAPQLYTLRLAQQSNLSVWISGVSRIYRESATSLPNCHLTDIFDVCEKIYEVGDLRVNERGTYDRRDCIGQHEQRYSLLFAMYCVQLI
jgi:hypothetical protein